MTAYAARPDVELGVEVGVEGTGRAGLLVVAWTLTNAGHEPLLVVDRVPRPSGASLAWDPRTAYVVGAGDGLVQVASRLFPLPETDRMSWARPPRVGATELAAGASLAREVAVPLPLVRSSPWGDDIGFGPIRLPDPVTSVQYCLGVVTGEPQPSWGLERVDGVVLLAHGGGAVVAQHVLCSDPVPLG
ncbi:hypothetical protein F4692_001057 [Nocardioides cavernae]|uniref:Uncharacterized protein n=1 Tax=Nocardioides cavernae TaxID=1921566 RepID=A0A7Y9KSM2_9ACTN|nr:hypothetical protein [Nocardioides cavernae]NYE35953.1 hypothetical protein [Nocardioides cavernae]